MNKEKACINFCFDQIFKMLTNVTHYQEKSIKECPKQDDFQVASKTSTKKNQTIIGKGYG